VFIVLVATRRVFADCYDFQCCFAAGVGAAAAAAAGGIPGLGGVAGAAASAAGAPGAAVAGSRPHLPPWADPKYRAPEGPTMGPSTIGSSPGGTIDGPPVFPGFSKGSFWDHVGQVINQINDVKSYYQEHQGEADHGEYGTGKGDASDGLPQSPTANVADPPPPPPPPPGVD
jgi:hypothetical protein